MRILLLFFLFSNISYGSDSHTIKLLSTTSTRDSGLLEYLLPNFEQKYNVKVHVIALGTGQALQSAEKCNGDILLTHAPNLEKEFIYKGYGISRNEVMYNDFVIIGPKHDPADIQSLKSIIKVFERIYITNSSFISRGDGSGTNISENKIWNATSINPNNYSGEWYLESGQGMGATINIAIGIDAYTYTDRATWLKFNNKSNHIILFEGDSLMFNQYSLLKLNPKECINADNQNINHLHDWMLSKEGQILIGNYMYNGNRLFVPNYKKSYD